MLRREHAWWLLVRAVIHSQEHAAYLCFDVRLEVIGQQVVVRPMCDAVQNIGKEVFVAKNSLPDHVHCCFKLRIQLQSVKRKAVLLYSLVSVVSRLCSNDQTVRV